MERSDRPIGVVLAGGLGSRIGGRKAVVELRGRPLISYPLAALQGSLADVVVVAKPDTELPPLPGIPCWAEPPEPRHPLTGIVHALMFAGRRPVLVCAADLPFITAALLDRILVAEPRGAPAVVPVCDGTMQPLLALYLPAALGTLADAARAVEPPPLRAAVAAVGPRLLEVEDCTPFFNVNSPDDLVEAAALLGGQEPLIPPSR